ncbi:hypothetical protein KUA55_10250 [Enterococcus sp. ALS3]|uniref:Uncharacterized protein n=1 Tax=Enterococcus alishanensis TaxID=1303817 RepID=A0ABS6TDS7_9ENTE|nr:hypothetical protein [Enterococcus alishanensis]MBV7391063.1 hypothetical protein [Enterococcus alishanensis]
MQQKNNGVQLEWLDNAISVLEGIRSNVKDGQAFIIRADIDRDNELPDSDGTEEVKVVIDITYQAFNKK